MTALPIPKSRSDPDETADHDREPPIGGHVVLVEDDLRADD